MPGLITITAQYSNAVLVAILPYISDFAKKVDLPVALPVTTNSVKHFACAPFPGDVGGYVVLTNKYEFWFTRGHVQGFAAPHSFYRLQDFDRIPEYYGRLEMNTNEAVSLARHFLMSLGYVLKTIFADQTPQIVLPPEVSNNVVPVYRIQWDNPLAISAGNNAIDIEVNGQEKRVKYMYLSSRCFYRPNPIIDVPEPPAALRNDFSRSASNQLAGIVLPEISEFVSGLDLPTKSPVTQEEIEQMEDESPSWVFVKLKDHFRFWCCRGKVFSFVAPDAIYLSPPSDPQLPISAYTGEWKLDEQTAVRIVSEAIQKLGYSMIEGTPNIFTPNRVGKYIVPRFDLDWMTKDRRIQAEVDAGKGTIKSLYLEGLSRSNPAKPN